MKKIIKSKGTTLTENTTQGIKTNVLSGAQAAGSMEELQAQNQELEMRLRRSEDSLRKAERIARMGLFDFNFTDGTWTSSSMMDELLGIDQTFDHTMQGWLSLIHPDDRAMVEDYLTEEVIGRDLPFNKQYRIIRPADQQERWLWSRATMERTAGDQAIVFHGTSVDITESKRTERTLAYSKLELEQIFDTIHDGVVIIDSEGRISQCNNAALSLLGLSLDEFKGKSLTETNWAILREDGTKYPAEEYPGTVALRTGNDSIGIFYLDLPTRQGRVIEVKATAFYFRSESGRETTERNVLVTMSDITERSNAEKALKESEQFIRTITDNIPGMVAYWTANLLCTFANNDYINWFGRNKDQMIGIHIQELMGEELFKKNEHFIRAALQGEKQHFERELIKSNGEKGYTLAQYIPHIVSGKVLGFIALVTDITKVKQAEFELRKNAEELRRNNQLLEESQSIAKLGGWELDLTTGILYWTAETYRIHDTSPEEFNPTVDAGVDYFLPESKRIISEALELAITQGKGYDLYLETYTTKGRKIDVRTTCMVTMEEGKPAKLTGIFQDITEQRKTEAKLQETNARLQLATQAAKIGIWDRNLITDTSVWDKTMLSIHGLTDSKLDINVHQNWQNLIHPDDRSRVIEEYARALKDRNTFSTEHRIVWGDGSLHYLKSAAIIQRDDNGKAIRVIGTVMDVTENRLNEINLKANENRLRTIIENEPECVKVTDRNGNLVEMNAAGLAMLGVTSIDQVKSYQLINFIKPAYREAFEDLHKRVIQGETGKLEFEIVSLLGEERFLQTHAVPIRNEKNEVESLLGITRDITVQKLAKQALEESEGKYRLLYEFNLMPIAVFEVETLKFLSVNDAFVDKYGYTKEEFLNMTILNIRPESEIEKLKQSVKSKDNDIVNVGVFLHKKKSGEIIEVEIIRRDILFEGKKAKLVVIHDVTEKRQREQEILQLNNRLENQVAERTRELALANQELLAQNERIKEQAKELTIAKERAEESDRLKSAFLANMSHEIRTPMNGILGFAEILKKPDLSSEKQKQYISIIEKSGERMLNIINDIIDISKIESGGMNVSISKTDINEQLEFLYSFFKQETEKKGLALSLAKVLPSTKSSIYTDREKVYAVLTNLLKNAIKFTQSGSIEFGCTVIPIDLEHEPVTDRNELLFYVKDTGRGIASEQLGLIFERFRQTDDFRSSEGAGLGLTITKSYVEMLGGKIWVESEYDKGSVFYFTLPHKEDQ